MFVGDRYGRSPRQLHLTRWVLEKTFSKYFQKIRVPVVAEVGEQYITAIRVSKLDTGPPSPRGG